MPQGGDLARHSPFVVQRYLAFVRHSPETMPSHGEGMPHHGEGMPQEETSLRHSLGFTSRKGQRTLHPLVITTPEGQKMPQDGAILRQKEDLSDHSLQG